MFTFRVLFHLGCAWESPGEKLKSDVWTPDQLNQSLKTNNQVVMAAVEAFSSGTCEAEAGGSLSLKSA